MVQTNHTVGRRDVLELAGGALVAAGATGVGTAAPDEQIRVNVGYSAESGRQAALSKADGVVREFGFDAVTLRLPAAAADALAERRDVRYVERDGRMHALAQTYPWGVDRIDADVAHANGHTGAGVDVAIVDTGIDDDHPDLRANLGRGRAFVNCQGTNCNYAWSDDNGHGTHVSGTADAVDNSQGVVGVSTEATLHAVKVLDGTGSGSYSDVAAGIEYVADQGWDVANLGFGGSHSQAVQDAVRYAYNFCVVMVAPAGNSGPCTNCVSYPAAYPEVIAVGGYACDGGLASFSSQGPEVDLIAPSVDVLSTVPGGYERRSGTSMAAAHVTGTVALLMEAGVGCREERDLLCETAEDVGLGTDEQGCGLVDAAAALGYDSSDDGGCSTLL